jgi:hypothetical protein
MELKYLNYFTQKFNNKNYLILFIVFLIFLFFRVWLLPQTISFGWDQERDAQIVEKIVKFTGIPLIGPRVVGDNGFYLGPYFFYLLAPFYFLTSLHPYAIIYFVVFISLLFFIISFLCLRKVYDFKTATIFLLIWALLPAAIYQDKIAWNPVLIPLSFSIIILFLLKFQFKSKYFLILGLVLGLIFHIHFQGLFYSVLALVYLIRKNPKSYINFIWTILGFILTFTPLVIFDIRHQWLNSHLFINFFFSTTQSSKSLFSFIPVWTNFIGQITGIYNLIFSIILWFILVIYGFINRKKIFQTSFLILFLITPFAFAIYGHRPSEYYFNYLLPIIVLNFSIFISKIKLPTPIVFIIILIFFIESFNKIGINYHSLFYKDDIVKQAKTILKDNPVYITYDTPLGENNGFDYLVKYYKLNRTSDSSRAGVQFLIPRRDGLLTSGDISLFIPSQIN